MKTSSYFFIIFILCTITCLSQTHTWTGNGGDTNWTNPDNWDVFTVPTAVSDILISGAGINVNVQSSNNGATIVIEQGATLIVEGVLDITNSVTINQADINISTGGTLRNNGGTITIQNGAKLIVSETLDVTNTDITVEGVGSELDILTGASANNNGGTITIQNNAKLVVQSDITNTSGSISANGMGAEIIIFPDGSVQNNGGTITIQPNAKLIVEGDITNTSGSIVNNGTIEVEGDFTNAATLTTNGVGAEIIVLEDGLVQNNGGTITIQPNAKLMLIGDISGGTLNNNGTLEISGMLPKDVEDILITNNASFIVTESNQTRLTNVTLENTANGVIDISSNGGFLEQNQNSILNNEGIVRKSQGSTAVGNFYLVLEINNNGTIEILEDQTFLLLAGNRPFINMPSGILTGNGTFDITADFTNQGTISPGGDAVGTLEFLNNFSIDNGTLLIDIEDVDDFDKIEVLGGPDMTGNIVINSLENGTIGDEFTILNSSFSISSCNFPTEIYYNDGTHLRTIQVQCVDNSATLTIIDKVLNVLESPLTETVQISPNPTANYTTLTLPQEWLTNAEVFLEIFAANGKKINSKYIDTTEETLNTTSLVNGIYFIKLNTVKGTYTVKLVVNR